MEDQHLAVIAKAKIKVELNHIVVVKSTFTSSGNQGGSRNRIQSDRQADFKANPKNYKTIDRGGNLPNRGSFLNNFQQKSIDSFVNRNKYKNLINAGVYNMPPGMMAKILGFMNPPSK